jgi:5-methyltetrahydropteroyltriglutamate--homocysteine methyltransferase
MSRRRAALCRRVAAHLARADGDRSRCLRRTTGADFNSIRLICGINCAAPLIEHDVAPRYEGLLGDQQLAVGAADAQDLNVESPEIIVEQIRQAPWLAPEQTMITSSCGMNHLPRHIAFAKLQAISGAKRILSGRA